MKVTVIGKSCDSTFSIIQEVRSHDKIEILFNKIEQIIPCTSITELNYNGEELDKELTFKSYTLKNGDTIVAQTNNREWNARCAACMGCSYHNIMLMSANVARTHEAKSDFNHEIIKASMRQWISKLNADDQHIMRRFFNSAGDGNCIRFIICIKDTLKDYVNLYRNIEQTNLIGFDYCQLLDELRCPVCFTGFSLYSQSKNIPVQMCTVSEKHYTCLHCFQQLTCCCLCQGELCVEPMESNYFRKLLRKNMKYIEKYCLPTPLTDIDINDNQRPFAHGAFCNVYHVNNYAVKCPRVPASTKSDVEGAILHEIFLSRPLSHIPNILITYGGVRLPNYGLSIVTEFIDGPTLATALNEDMILNLPFSQRFDIALGICKGLGELHLAGIVHRDFKPDNILLQKRPNDGGYIPKIADFGVSFLIQTASATSVQKTGGTVGYDAPEVADGNIPTFRSDIYALSFTLYELLTVQRPFANLKDTQIITRFTLKGERPKDWTLLSVHQSQTVMPNLLKNAIEKGWTLDAENRATIGEIIHAIRKSIQPNSKTCAQMFAYYLHSAEDTSESFMDQLDSLQLLAVQEIFKRLIIEDNEAIQIFLTNYCRS